MTNRPSISVAGMIRRVWLGQMLFSAGHALTSGGFLSYFTNPYFRGVSLAFAIFQITPEAAESLSIVTRWLVRRLGDPKRVWWGSLLLARLSALMIPLWVIQGAAPDNRLTMGVILASLAVWHLLQGISFTAYLSWLSQQTPEMNWGRLLASRSIAISLVTILTTWTASRLVDWTVEGLGWNKQLVYPVLFVTGGALCLLSIVPLLGIRGTHVPAGDISPPAVPIAAGPPLGTMIQQAWSNREFRNFLLGSWQLAFFQGLTQTAQFELSKNILQVSLSSYYSMMSLMLLLQIPLAAVGGWFADRQKERSMMVWGLLVLSLAMGFWFLASLAGPHWLWGAYAIWGVFGLVNVAQPCLGLKLAPRSDNTLHLALVRPIGGLLAALSGMLGGAILDRYAQGKDWAPITVFQTLFVVSGLGRALAAGWFLPVRRHCDENPPKESA